MKDDRWSVRIFGDDQLVEDLNMGTSTVGFAGAAAGIEVTTAG